MARSKKKQRPMKQEVDDDEELHVYDEPDPERDDYYQDDIDKFHADRDKILLDITAEQNQQGESDDNVEDYQNEMMLLDVEESGDEDDSDNDFNHEQDHEKKEEEDEDEDEDAADESESDSDSDSGKNVSKGIPSQKSWGRKKDTFYDADIVEEYAGSDEEMDKLAEEEEEEALALQKQMAAALEEQDFDTAEFEFPKTVQEKDDDVHQEKIVQDLSKLSKAEKIEILLKDSPELLNLLEEFTLKLKEIIEKLHPLVVIARAGKVPEQGANYLELKHQLCLNYCVNIGFYLLLKAKQAPVRNHPVIGRLVQYRKLIQELEPLDKKVEPELEVLLTQQQKDMETGVMDTSAMEVADAKVQPVETKKKRRKRNRKRKLEQSLDSMDPLDYYEAVKLQKMKSKEAKKASVGVSDHLELHQEDSGKRGITYEISQNKGLTAKKKKELRNPRVKHRRKFSKAQMKRKSQVRPVVNEEHRYGGEMTGIRSHLTRSVKIK